MGESEPIARLALQLAVLAILVAFGAVALVMRWHKPDVFQENEDLLEPEEEHEDRDDQEG